MADRPNRSIFTTDQQMYLYYGKLNPTIARKLANMTFQDFQCETLWTYFKVFLARRGKSYDHSSARMFAYIKTYAVSTHTPEDWKLLLTSFFHRF